MGEFGVCGGSWWNSSQNLFGLSSCSLPINDTGNFEEWKSHDTLANTTCTSYDSTGSASDKSVLLQEFDQPNTNGNMASTDSNVNMMESSFFWNQEFVLDNAKLDENYSHLLQEEATPFDSSMNDSSSNSSLLVPTSSSLYNYNSVQNLLRHLFDIDSQPEQSIEDNYSLSLINSNDFLSSLSKASSNPKVKQQNHSQVMQKKTKDGPIFKRPRIETPSPLPTFKVRKEKMGDRITALQQLVSPFGKTDTASVLYEAIEYIKFLHDQVNTLSSPYLKSDSPLLHCQQATQKVRHEELELNKDLKSRGLCLVPVSSTFPVASETTDDFWTPTFGGCFN